GGRGGAPPVPAVLESDDRLRARTQMGVEGFSTAGARGAYVFHAFSASGRVEDVAVHSPEPGVVEVIVLASPKDEQATDAAAIAAATDAQLLALVGAALNAEDVRPLTDLVRVVPPRLRPYEVRATLVFFPVPDAARAAVADYAKRNKRLGHSITRSGLFRALHQDGVQNVDIQSPSEDLRLELGEFAYVEPQRIDVRNGGVFRLQDDGEDGGK